jgi:hypothetical protein
MCLTLGEGKACPSLVSRALEVRLVTRGSGRGACPALQAPQVTQSTGAEEAAWQLHQRYPAAKKPRETGLQATTLVSFRFDLRGEEGNQVARGSIANELKLLKYHYNIMPFPAS